MTRPLDPCEVHVWIVPLEQSDEATGRIESTLSAEERERAARYRFPRDRRRFIVARGALRHTLGEYLNEAASAVRLRNTGNGKPYLPEYPSLSFNLSHSHELALLAFTRIDEVGIDVERTRAVAELEAIARRFFSSREYDELSSMPPQDRRDAFFRCWTRKEAYIKAVGAGLTVPLNAFDVSLAAEEPPRLRAFRHSHDNPGVWSLYHLEPAPHYVGALALRGVAGAVRWWSWSADISA